MGGNKSKVDPTILTPKQIALLKANTRYSESEIQQWHEGFIRDCPNGRLDKKKFTEVYSQFFPGGNATEYAKYAFETFDANDDGTINFDEFLLSVSATSKGDLDERLSFAFDLYDISDDGQIDQKELTKVLGSIYSLTGKKNLDPTQDPKKRAAEIIASLDISGEKKLSKEEFISGCKNDPYIRQALAPNA